MTEGTSVSRVFTVYPTCGTWTLSLNHYLLSVPLIQLIYYIRYVPERILYISVEQETGTTTGFNWNRIYSLFAFLRELSTSKENNKSTIQSEWQKLEEVVL
jgi:hypothetical protein